jgi:hypothetical protein
MKAFRFCRTVALLRVTTDVFTSTPTTVVSAQMPLPAMLSPARMCATSLKQSAVLPEETGAFVAAFSFVVRLAVRVLATGGCTHTELPSCGCSASTACGNRIAF